MKCVVIKKLRNSCKIPEIVSIFMGFVATVTDEGPAKTTPR